MRYQKSEDQPDYNINKFRQNTKKNPGEWRRFVVIQTLVKDHQLTQLWNTLKVWNNNGKGDPPGIAL